MKTNFQELRSGEAINSQGGEVVVRDPRAEVRPRDIIQHRLAALLKDISVPVSRIAPREGRRRPKDNALIATFS